MKPNDFDVLTVSEGPHAARDLNALVNKHLARGFQPWLNVMTHQGLVMQGIENYKGGDYCELYELKLLGALSANELVTKVRDLKADGWELYLNMVSGERYIFQWMLRVRKDES